MDNNKSKEQVNLKQICFDLITEANELADKLRETKIKELGLIDKQFDKDFDDFVFIASKICQTEVSQINLFDADHQLVKVRIGTDGPIVGPKADSICACTTLQSTEITVIPDATVDQRVKETSWVKNKLVRFYAGAPLITDDGIAIGTLCVYDYKEPRELSDEQKQVLAALARLVSSMLVKVK